MAVLRRPLGHIFTHLTFTAMSACLNELRAANVLEDSTALTVEEGLFSSFDIRIRYDVCVNARM